MLYKCAKCGRSVARLPDGRLIRACKCEAGVLAEMSAVAKGKGGLKQK